MIRDGLARVLSASALAVAAVAAHAQDTGAGPAASQACLAPGGWYQTASGKPRITPAAEVLGEIARRDVVLLGERHDEADHHQWQLQTLAALHLLRPQMVIGFESFPRRVQPVLESWIAGELTPKQFLERVEWEKIWNFPPGLYLPLFDFARLNRIPIVALNVERSLTEAINSKGWDAVPGEQKEGVSRPAAPTGAYEDYLFEVFKQHARPAAKGRAQPSRSDGAFRFFVESQTTWDRAMAEALAGKLDSARGPRPLVVGIMGAGHVRQGHGVAHQLRDLGVTNIATLLPVDAGTECGELKPGLADAVFALQPAARDKAPPPRLGVRLESADGGVRIAAVDAGSLAEQHGIQVGDRILSVGGTTASMSSFISAVRNQPPGTWLPLQIRRAEGTLELVVKFPPGR